MGKPKAKRPDPQVKPAPEPAKKQGDKPPAEVGGRKGPEPTRYGDWEKGGRAIDF